MGKIKGFRGPLFLVLASFLWGTTFLAQSAAAKAGIPPLAYNGTRMLLGAFLLLPAIRIRGKGGALSPLKEKKARRDLLTGGALCGIFLCVATFFQQYGLTLGTPAGKSAFISAFYVVLVPVVGIFFGRRVKPLLWIAVLASLAGMYFLCLADFSAPFSASLALFSLAKGDFMTLLSALCFAFQILFVGKYVEKCDVFYLSFFQFLTAGTVSLAFSLFTETITAASFAEGWWCVLYAAFFSCAIAYTLQVAGQKETPPAVASVLMCLESVFALLCDLILFHHLPRPEEWIGSAVLFGAILFASLA